MAKVNLWDVYLYFLNNGIGVDPELFKDIPKLMELYNKSLKLRKEFKKDVLKVYEEATKNVPKAWTINNKNLDIMINKYHL